MALRRPAAAIAPTPRGKGRPPAAASVCRAPPAASVGRAPAATPVKSLKRPAAANVDTGSTQKEKRQRAERDAASPKLQRTPQKAERDGSVKQVQQIEEVSKFFTQHMSAQLSSDMKAFMALVTQNTDREEKMRAMYESQIEKLRQKLLEEQKQERKAWENERKLNEQDRKAYEQEVKTLQNKLSDAYLKRGEAEGRLEMLSTIYAEQSAMAIARPAPAPALLDADVCTPRNATTSAKTMTATKMRRHGRQARAPDVAAAEALVSGAAVATVPEVGAGALKKVATPRSAKAVAIAEAAAIVEAMGYEIAPGMSKPKASTTIVSSPGPPTSALQALFGNNWNHAPASTAGIPSFHPRTVGSLWGLKPLTPYSVEQLKA